MSKKDEVIVSQAKKNLELNKQVKSFKEKQKKIKSLLTSIGGPLNDNIKKYNKEQIGIFIEIENILS